VPLSMHVVVSALTLFISWVLQALIRAVYERAVAHVPPIAEKRFWRRYIYLWIYYALYEETVAADFDRARTVLQRALAVVPHAVFTFSKLWLHAAHFEVCCSERNDAV
jgi:crooked neck